MFGSIKILYQIKIGKRYLVKFDTQNNELSKRYSNIILNDESMLLESDIRDDKIRHFGILLCEKSPYCLSKYSKKYVHEHSCVHDNCEIPHLNFIDKIVCDLMYCNCPNEDCPSQYNCTDLLLFILQFRSDLYTQRNTDPNFEQNTTNASRKYNGRTLTF
jgi:hypothetical protein